MDQPRARSHRPSQRNSQRGNSSQSQADYSTQLDVARSAVVDGAEENSLGDIISDATSSVRSTDDFMVRAANTVFAVMHETEYLVFDPSDSKNTYASKLQLKFNEDELLRLDGNMWVQMQQSECCMLLSRLLFMILDSACPLFHYWPAFGADVMDDTPRTVASFRGWCSATTVQVNSQCKSIHTVHR